ncbi:TPA: transcriptional regulator DdlR [Clostridioides difficile]|uniref:GntR family transcriptional regulator n=2 Tax=Clostridioides difficile TaxID=1496 RepID=A0AC59FYE0_CLODI|nr:transcriptional regulator DdlR [Clostridioides difficile]AKP42350.1 GntR family transcriptional regulator [Clostridioides difficile ATCC 9689 = DSM 1296]ARC14070.1 PLP-dependent aminotransferase family protein [Clostridioides difficile]AVI11932.1 PLP-dependent aminotransferase family protein [Clostridioides difficile]AXU86294.1 GntR family transcriptional regulator [Clostridioides difficile]EGT3643464.1 PLP-dependent aminotransferase family protein [Clostridioides difficile]
MIFSNLKLNDNEPIYIQLKNYISDMISKGLIPDNSKLPSTRELSQLLQVSRNSVVLTYEELKSEGLIYSISGKGTFVKSKNKSSNTTWSLNWDCLENTYSKKANELDIIKSEIPWSSDLISFKSISPDGDLFDMEELKKSFLNRISLEGHKLLNYGYAQGYKPLIDYLLEYMTNKGADISNKDILITNGFTEGFDIIMSSFTQEKDYIICENPTHNTAIKIMKSHNLNILGVDINEDGLDFNMLEDNLVKYKNKIKFAYITPSYHNPTGIVMTPENRYKFYNLMKKYNIATIEDGFNEELLYNSSHIFPICSLDNMNNGVVYIGSFSKILFPGMRIGWIFADKKVINKLESVKRCRNIHVSFLDQGILFDYLSNGGFEKYIKKIRKFYGDKFNFAYKCIKKYIKTEYILGDGGLHIFIKLKNIDTRVLLEKCYEKNVIFMPGDLFFTDNSGFDTLRLGFSRLSFEDIEIGIKIIGETINEMF